LTSIPALRFNVSLRKGLYERQMDYVYHQWFDW
jgi:hypothetical protein